MPNEAKQRFISLDVAEVSVVDTPANEVEFLVHKRMEDPIMGDTNENATAPAAVEKGAQAPEVIAQPAEAANAAVEKAMAQVTALVEGIAKAARASTDPEEARDAEVEKAQKGAGAARKAFRAKLKAAGMEGDALKKAMSAFDDTLTTDAQPLQQRAQKSAEGAESTEGQQEQPAAKSAQDIASEALATMEEQISKAKMFTPARQQKFKAALDSLKAVMDEMTTYAEGANPPTKTPANPTFGASDVQQLTKAIGDQMAEVVKVFREGLAEVTKRVEAVEKARLPGNSQGADSTDGAPVETKKSLWSGLL